MTWPDLLSLQTASPQLLQEHVRIGPLKELFATGNKRCRVKRNRRGDGLLQAHVGNKGMCQKWKLTKGTATQSLTFSTTKKTVALTKQHDQGRIDDQCSKTHKHTVPCNVPQPETKSCDIILHVSHHL